MVGHWVTLPHPDENDEMRPSGIHRVVNVHSENTLAFHFLYGDCPCSRRVLRHVVDRMPLDGAREHIVLIGQDDELVQLAQSQGFSVDVVTPRTLKQTYGVEAAPLLVVTDGEGRIQYSGGYTSRKQGLDIQDIKIIQQVMVGDKPIDLPLYGCAVSKKLKSIIDPLHFK